MLKTKLLVSIASMGIIGSVGVCFHYWSKKEKIFNEEQQEDPETGGENNLPKIKEHSDIKLTGKIINDSLWVDGWAVEKE